ncbi:MAG: GGDEF domain-containing protein [Candidatus Dormibacteria bacterium]
MPSEPTRRRILGVSHSKLDSARVPPRPAPADPERAPEDAPDLPVDLVGWATGHRLETEEPVGPELARELLSTALGVRQAELASLDDDGVTAALERLRALVRQIQRLSAAAAVDDLTGALRRGAGLQAMTREIARYHRFGGKGVAAIFIDVDGLKRINDTEGHAAGDSLLANVVGAIRERLRAYDLVIRWGGDEFVCVLPDATRGEAERTLADIEQHVRDRTSGRTVSTGLAALEDGDTAASLVGRADAALYARRGAIRARS